MLTFFPLLVFNLILLLTTFTNSLKVTVINLVIDTFTEFFDGTTFVTLGGVLSVVNFELKSVKPLPSRSVTDPAFKVMTYLPLVSLDA